MTKLKARLRELVLIMEELSDEEKKNIIKKLETIVLNLQNVGKKPKKYGARSIFEGRGQYADF